MYVVGIREYLHYVDVHNVFEIMRNKTQYILDINVISWLYNTYLITNMYTYVLIILCMYVYTCIDIIIYVYACIDIMYVYYICLYVLGPLARPIQGSLAENDV